MKKIKECWTNQGIWGKVGIVAVCLQLLISALLIFLLLQSRMIPGKYIAAVAVIWMILLGLALLLCGKYMCKAQVLMSVFISLFSIGLAYATNLTTSAFANISTVNAKDSTSRGAGKAESADEAGKSRVQKEQKDSGQKTTDQETFQLLISGSDQLGYLSDIGRSDVNIIASVSAASHKVLLVNTPRDYYVTIPGISGEEKDKLTHAGIYGVEASVKTVEQLYGIDIAYYVKVNLSSLIRIVDAIDGVDVDVDQDFTAGSYTFVKGNNHMNGQAALAFCRERYSFIDGDNQRGKNQQKVVTAIFHKMISADMLLKVPELLDYLQNCFETNMPYDMMAGFVRRQLEDNASWDVQSISVTGTGDEQECYSAPGEMLYVMQPDMESVKSASEAIKAN